MEYHGSLNRTDVSGLKTHAPLGGLETHAPLGSCSGEGDWLDWLDTLLRHGDAGPKTPLYLVFPDFMANYAQWGSTKYEHIGDENWLAESLW